MDLKSQKNEKKQVDSINIENIKDEEYTYIIDSKNILRIYKSKNINEDLGKYFGLQLDTSEEDIINQSTNSSMTNSVGNTSLDNNAQKLMHMFTEKLYPKCNLDCFLISKKLSTQYFKKNPIDKNKIEDCVNYIHNKKLNITYSNFFNFDLISIKNLGYILMMSYYKFNEFKINDRKTLKSNIKNTLKESKDVIQDFLNYCNKKKALPDHHKKTAYWDKYSQNYYLPGIFIFLINCFEKVETIYINFNTINDMLTSDEVDLIAIIIYNVQFIFTNVNHVKLNIIHKKLQCYIFSKYLEEYYNALNLFKGDLNKKFFQLDFIYDEKWDFKTEFLIDELKEKYKKQFLEEKKNKSVNIMNKAKTNDLPTDVGVGNDLKNNVKVSSRSRITEFFQDIKSNFQQRFTVQPGEGISQKLKNSEFLNDIEEEINDENEQYAKNNPDIIYNKIDIGNDFGNTLKAILLAINSINRFTNLCKLDLVFNDSYIFYISNLFENEIFDQENKSINMPLLKDFHILDIISNKFMKLNTMNLEINSLDSITFKKILESINSNASSFLSLYMSFFSSDVTYSPQSLYKLNNSQNLEMKNWREGVEHKILDNLLSNFSTNLQILFNLIRIKKMQKLGFNFDIPYIIENKEKYIMVIIKFILNILLYINKKDTIIQKLIILAPKIKMNNDFYPFINKVLGNINSNDINKIIKELSFEMQLYKVINIKNIISESLIILNIGKCDFFTFKELVKFLSSFKFCFYSSLSKIKISLIKTLRILNKEIYNLLFILFNIKIKQLKQLNLYTNIILNHIKEYLYLLNIFNNNWISICTLTLNQKSQNIYQMEKCEEERKKIKYLVPAILENDLFSSEDMVLKKKINKDIIINKNDDVYWYLKYMFKIRYSCIDNGKKKRNESLSKFLTNNILSYIHLQKNITIYHNLDEKNSYE